MASYPPSQCCIVGVKHEGEAVGTIEKVGGCESSRHGHAISISYLYRSDDAYIARPDDKSTRFGVVLFPDFMGYDLINAKLSVTLDG